MPTDTDSTGALHIRTLADALGVGLELLDLFVADGDCCALWLGGPAGEELDFVLCADERGRDIDRLLRYAALGAALHDDVTGAVLWRTVDDITDGWALTDAFFDHRAALDTSGLTLLDEIARREAREEGWPPWG